MTYQLIMKFGLVITLIYTGVKNSKAQNLTSDSLLLATIDSITNESDYDRSDLIPPKFNSYTLKNIYFFESDSNIKQGDITILSLRDNCTFIYETFHKNYNNSRIRFAIGTYKVSRHSIDLTYEPLLEGEKGKIYHSPILPVSWELPKRPECVLIDRDRLYEPKGQKRNKRVYYKVKKKEQFEIRNCK